MSFLEQQAAHMWHGSALCFLNDTLTGNATLSRPLKAEEQSSTLWVGVVLSALADAIIAVSLNIQKLAHNRNADPKTGKPVKPFVRLPLWWVGILLNGGGELGNMLAYGFAPAAIVAPVGSVGVIVNELIAVIFLKEPLRKRDLLGLVGVVAGVVLLILGVPESELELNAHTLLTTDILFAPRSYWYIISLIVIVITLMGYLEPRYAQRHILVWLMMCSIISSMTVISCRGFASMVTLVPEDCARAHCQHGVLHPPCSETIGHWLFWFQLVIIVITAVWSAYYLNKAMQVFGNTETVPVYYCTFSLMSIIGGAIVFNEFSGVTGGKAAMFGCGVVLALLGVCLITSNRTKAQRFQGITQVDEKLQQLEDDIKFSSVSFGSAGASTVTAKIIQDLAVDEDLAREKMLAAHLPGTLTVGPASPSQASKDAPPPSALGGGGTGSSSGSCGASPTTVVELGCSRGGLRSSAPARQRMALGASNGGLDSRATPLAEVVVEVPLSPQRADAAPDPAAAPSASPSASLSSPDTPSASGSLGADVSAGGVDSGARSGALARARQARREAALAPPADRR